jgi:hypothetical protein
MKTVVLSIVAYAVFKTLPSLLLSLALLLSTPRPSRPDPTGDLLLAGYLIGLSTGFSVLGFLLGTAWSAAWRRLSTKRAVMIAGALGLAAPIANLVFAMVAAPILLPMLRSGHWLAVPFQYGFGGLVLGGIAVLIARAGRLAPQRV